MAKSYLANIHTRKIIAENVIFHNLYIFIHFSKYVQLYNQKKKKFPTKPLQNITASDLKSGLKIFVS